MEKRKAIRISDQKVMMDYVDVRDELESLMHHYESLVRTLPSSADRYVASRKAVALMEACNLITRFLRHPEEFNNDDVSGIEAGSEE